MLRCFCAGRAQSSVTQVRLLSELQFKAIRFMHANSILLAALKPGNILLEANSSEGGKFECSRVKPTVKRGMSFYPCKYTGTGASSWSKLTPQ
jgi:hypothetical protein